MNRQRRTYYSNLLGNREGDWCWWGCNGRHGELRIQGLQDLGLGNHVRHRERRSFGLVGRRFGLRGLLDDLLHMYAGFRQERPPCICAARDSVCIATIIRCGNGQTVPHNTLPRDGQHVTDDVDGSAVV